MRLRCGDAAGQALQAGVTLQLFAQLVNVQRFAHAAVVQGVCDVHNCHALAGDTGSDIGHGASLALAAMLGEVGQECAHVLKIGAVDQVATTRLAAG